MMDQGPTELIRQAASFASVMQLGVQQSVLLDALHFVLWTHQSLTALPSVTATELQTEETVEKEKLHQKDK